MSFVTSALKDFRHREHGDAMKRVEILLGTEDEYHRAAERNERRVTQSSLSGKPLNCGVFKPRPSSP
jgi:hypothetical protein